ncbi:cell division protein ZapE [Rhizosaccharibacter radicis]|uniref:Cell division protein ZapE n=1 Tax=Rhizosaccharibacter radicis TaxID=2782605 RepID=A0ABT1VZW0_9PROT|nr:cell division protein ZapE [Acetobacteraceae bacterium KSS12]
MQPPDSATGPVSTSPRIRDDGAGGSTLPAPDPRRDGPLAGYRRRLALGILDEDPEQRRAAERLDMLWRELDGYRPARADAGGRRGGLWGLLRRSPPPPPRGVYLVGQVGRGKSMLMDLFFDHAPVDRKRRIHFHRFMQDSHAAVHRLKRERPELSDPIPPLADSVASEASLLCFDEFQVNDIADAMILGRLFEALFARGVVVVATSNIVPDQLFQNRPGADAFKPFIAQIKAAMDTLVLDSPRDYRRGNARGSETWLVPADARADAALDQAFLRLCDGEAPHPETLTVMGRPVPVPRAASGVARFDFDELCDRNLGAGDYLAIARRFPALVIDGVPRLGPENFDVARRFIVLVDALYESKVKLLASAADQPDRIYERGEGAFAFERTASRLEEMRSAAYLALAHLDG